MKTFKRVLCLFLMLVMLAGLALSGHALGYRLSGTATSFGDASEATYLQLMRNGATVPDCEWYFTGLQTDYSLGNIDAGNYTLTVSKQGHVTRTYQVDLSTSNLSLDVKICLQGDVSGDGKINMSDISTAYAHIRGTRLITDSYKLACADFGGNGKFNMADIATIYAVAKGTYQPPVKSVSLSVWVPVEDLSDSDNWLLQMEEGFQKAHPEYKINWVNGVCSEGDALSMVGSDPEAAADVYMFPNDQMGMLIDAGALLQLGGQYLEQVLADNSQTLVNTVTHTDNGVYGFPVVNNTWFMYYNKDVFSEEDIKSLDTMLNKGTVAFPWGVAWYSGTFFLANGGSVFGGKGNDAAAGIQFGKNNGGYEAALKMIQLANNPNMICDTNGAGWDGMRNGSIGAYFSGSWDYAGLYEQLGDSLGVAALPTVEIGGEQKQMKAFAGSKAVGVNPHASDPQLAASFAAYLSTPEAQKARYEYRGVIPAATSLANDPVVGQDAVAQAEINTMAYASVVQPSIPEMGYYWTPVGNFGWNIAIGEVNSYNYRTQVDQLIYELNADDTNSYVTLKVWAPSDDLIEDGWMETMQNSFAAAHPEVNIIWENEVCHAGDAGTMVSMDPEAAADVYLFANDQLGTLVNAGALKELTGASLNQVLEDNSQTLVNTVSHTDDGVYGFPVSNNTWFMYYNKDIFTEEDVKSLDTMLTKGKVAFPWNTGWYSGTFFLANGGTLFGEKGNDAAAGIQFGKNNGGYDAALKMIELAANPNLIEDIDGAGWVGLTSGAVGAYFSGSWDYMALYDYLGDKLGTVQLPTVEIGGVQKQMKAFAGSKAIGVNPHADNVELAEAFAAYLATPEAQMLHYQYTGLIPSAVSLTNDPVISNDPVALAEINNMANASVVQPSIPEMGRYWTPIGDFGGRIADGTINVSNYKAQVDELLSALNYD